MADWITTGNAGTNPPNEFLGTTDQQPLVVKVAGAEALRVDLGGNVGVGTTEPQTPLHVLGRISSGADSSTAGAITLFPPDGWAWFHIDNGPTGGRPLGRMRFSYGVSPGENELMNLFQDGNIGVGTDAPEAKLKVSSEGTFDAPQLHVEQTTTNDFARLRFNTADFPVGPQQTPQPKDFWDIAVGGPDNVLNIYHDSAPGVSGPFYLCFSWVRKTKRQRLSLLASAPRRPRSNCTSWAISVSPEPSNSSSPIRQTRPRRSSTSLWKEARQARIFAEPTGW
jgi:hypothetical protein